MTIRFRHAAGLLILLAASTIAVDAQRGQSGQACDKACLQGIFGGKMHEIEAMGFSLPIYSKNGWSPFIK